MKQKLLETLSEKKSFEELKDEFDEEDLRFMLGYLEKKGKVDYSNTFESNNKNWYRVI